MVPEISHRCPACGFSIRDGERVMFCPECGKALTEKNDGDSAMKTDEPGNPNTPGVAPPPVAWPVEDEKTKLAANENPVKVHDDRQSARGRTREKLQRASQRTRGAIEGNVKRVEKIHHVSSVVLEEATYDPSLRFVLVALGLFVLAIILLVLSKVMG